MSQQQIAACLKHGELVAVMQRMCPADVYWLFEFLFPNTSVRFSDNGMFNLLEIIEDAVGPAEFAALCAVSGNVISTGQTLNLEAVAAPYIYEEAHLGVCDTDSMIINPMTGMEFASWQEKMDYHQALKAAALIKRLRKRLEMMASELLKTGQMTIDGKNVEKSLIDFKRNPNNEVMVDAADRWCAATSKPLDMLGDIANNVFECEGEGTIDLIISQKAVKALTNHTQIIDLMKLQANNQCTGSLLDMNMFPNSTRVIGQKLVGQFGDFRVWQFDGKLKLPSGTVSLLNEDDGYMVMRDAFKGTRGYGSIKDMTGLYRETAFFSSTVRKKGIKMEFESRPLPIPGNINATAVLKGIVGGC